MFHLKKIFISIVSFCISFFILLPFSFSQEGNLRHQEKADVVFRDLEILYNQILGGDLHGGIYIEYEYNSKVPLVFRSPDLHINHQVIEQHTTGVRVVTLERF